MLSLLSLCYPFNETRLVGQGERRAVGERIGPRRITQRGGCCGEEGVVYIRIDCISLSKDRERSGQPVRLRRRVRS